MGVDLVDRLCMPVLHMFGGCAATAEQTTWPGMVSCVSYIGCYPRVGIGGVSDRA